MGTNQNFFDGRQTTVRQGIVNAMHMILYCIVALDIGFFLLYCKIGFDLYSPLVYFLKRMVLPFIINVASYVVAKKAESSEELEDRKKNVYLAFSLMTLSGSMSIFHSFFTPLWCGPCFCIVICCIFNDRKLMQNMLLYDYVLVVLSAGYVILERPESVSVFLQQFVVVMILSTVVYWGTTMVQEYHMNVMNNMQDMYEKKMEYEKKLHYDYLTKVYSRSYIRFDAKHRIDHWNGTDCLSVSMIDIDNFKTVNDNYGHDAGDQVLKRLGRILGEYMSENMSVGRYGGEEFIVIIQGGKRDEHILALEYLRRKFESSTYKFTSSAITFSCGMSFYENDMGVEELIEQADRALYLSKWQGKNQISLADEVDDKVSAMME